MRLLPRFFFSQGSGISLNTFLCHMIGHLGVVRTSIAIAIHAERSVYSMLSVALQVWSLFECRRKLSFNNGHDISETDYTPNMNRRVSKHARPSAKMRAGYTHLGHWGN